MALVDDHTGEVGKHSALMLVPQSANPDAGATSGNGTLWADSATGKLNYKKPDGTNQVPAIAGGVVLTTDVTGVLPVANGGTAGATAAAARTALSAAQSGVASGTPSATSAPAFTGTAATAAENIASPAFTGTGQSSAGQVITTTDNQTMTLNQCAGMWFISATHGPYLIASNTAVVGAQAVITIYGTAPTTDAGTYKIISGMTPVGTVAAVPTTTHTHTQS